MFFVLEEEMRHKEVKYLCKWQSRDSNPENLAMHATPPMPVHEILFFKKFFSFILFIIFWPYLTASGIDHSQKSFSTLKDYVILGPLR